MKDLPKAPPVPCGSCPYRKDVPSGIWSKHEYDKLPAYDGEVIDQLAKGAVGVFMCHQQDGHLCGGWLACHGPRNLAALISPHVVAPEAYDYKTAVPVFASGAEARKHGIRDIKNPGARARKMIENLMRKRNGK